MPHINDMCYIVDYKALLGWGNNETAVVWLGQVGYLDT